MIFYIKYHLFLRANPSTKKTKNGKQQAQWAKYQSWNRKKCCNICNINAFVLQIWRTLQKALKKKSREFCFTHRAWESAPATYCACHLPPSYLVYLYILWTTPSAERQDNCYQQTNIRFHQQTTTKWGAPDEWGLACLETKSHWWMGGKNDLNNNDLCISALNHFTVASMASLSFKSFKNSKNLNDYDLCISALHFSVGSLSFKSLRYPLKINKINKKPPLLAQRARVSGFYTFWQTGQVKMG